MKNSLKRIWTIFMSRNREFCRDRSAFGWNILFPFLIVVGFGLIFNNREYSAFKIGYFGADSTQAAQMLPERFASFKYIKLIEVNSLDEGLSKLRHHKIDLLLQAGEPPYPYWINDTSPQGYVAEKLLFAGLAAESELSKQIARNRINGGQVRYIDWFFPGILAMNMMFSSLWGVGYVVVRYRKNGVLKRLQATPLTPFEYLCAQLLSRLFLLMFTFLIVWIGCDFFFDFEIRGSYGTFVLVFLAGGINLCSLGLILAARGTSEEFTTGVLNLISWPMMFLSEVWFSLEGAPAWIQSASRFFPLTHMTVAARAVMNDGAGLLEIVPHLAVLMLTAALFLLIGGSMFSWNK